MDQRHQLVSLVNSHFTAAFMSLLRSCEWEGGRLQGYMGPLLAYGGIERGGVVLDGNTLADL
ncbi:hypothetical protein E2C01_035896 [Portunus trituberculatus]|uniref:Uncharacterized protein n=1 Tax=Portunus trituberculatus TaxID=210409 RepID=A0A5B7F9P9_PORTR|nr:hypothetical protein [Portunus trituberculatus]